MPTIEQIARFRDFTQRDKALMEVKSKPSIDSPNNFLSHIPKQPVGSSDEDVFGYGEFIYAAPPTDQELAVLVQDQQKHERPLKPSRLAQRLIQKAEAIGVNPAPYLIRAENAARESGKGKIGKFGGARGPLHELQTAIETHTFFLTTGSSIVRKYDQIVLPILKDS